MADYREVGDQLLFQNKLFHQIQLGIPDSIAKLSGMFCESHSEGNDV